MSKVRHFSRFRSRLGWGLSVLWICAGCSGKTFPIAFTRLGTDRMEVIVWDPPRRFSAGEVPGDFAAAAAFGFEPRWNAPHTHVALTRIDVRNDARRMLSVYDRKTKQLGDIAIMEKREWSGYGFSPAWDPTGDALAFKLRGERQSGVFAAVLPQNRTVQLLPDAAGQVRELTWGAPGLFFSVETDAVAKRTELRFLPLSPAKELAQADVIEQAKRTRSLGPGFLPRYHDGALYFIRRRDDRRGFDLIEDKLDGSEQQLLRERVGPYFDISTDGEFALQCDPDGAGHFVRVAFWEPGEEQLRLSPLSAFRFRFSPGGERLMGLRVVAGSPRYFIYDRKAKQTIEIAVLRDDLSAEALAELVDRPLFDW